jgi:hypothetical protein
MAEGKDPARTGAEVGDSTPSAASAPQPHASPPAETSVPSEPLPSRMVRAGRTIGALITAAAALGGLILGIRAEQRASDEKARTDSEKAKVYAERVDFYRLGAQVIVVNGSARAMAMRLVLRDRKLWWDLEALRPCTQIAIPNNVLFESMTREVPGLRLTQEDLAGLRLEFRDPQGRSWIRTSGGAVSSSEGTSELPGVLRVSDEDWNLQPENSPDCG